jgi:N-acetylglucosaminyl-diphospho-decaprenol L-rhamnosyltransferase
MLAREVNEGIRISISIVSHGHGDLVGVLLNDLRQYCDSKDEILLTLNFPEELAFDLDRFPFPLRVIRNVQPKGFAANHNAAFRCASGGLFCVLNPDVRLSSDPFLPLIDCLRQGNVGVAAPRVVNPQGELEDSARPFPTPLAILGKMLGLRTGRYPTGREMDFPDWVAGMFMLYPARVYRGIGGFDESYFLYYEDVDICARLRVAGYRAALCREAVVVHDARRSSHYSLKFLRWHAGSVMRFFLSPVYRQICRLSEAST